MSAEDQVRIHEIYESIQGESTFAGLPCTFVRLSRCNLRCRWCDTPYTSWLPEGARRDVAALVDEARALASDLLSLKKDDPVPYSLNYRRDKKRAIEQ